MRVKMVVFVLVAFFLLSTSVYAQQWPSTEQIIEKVQVELNLTDDQLDKVILIIEENMAKRKEITPQLEQGLTQAQAQPLDTELYTQLSQVLTREQMRRWSRVLDFMLKEEFENQKSE